jgi:hypothetical protein
MWDAITSLPVWVIAIFPFLVGTKMLLAIVRDALRISARLRPALAGTPFLKKLLTGRLVPGQNHGYVIALRRRGWSYQAP